MSKGARRDGAGAAGARLGGRALGGLLGVAACMAALGAPPAKAATGHAPLAPLQLGGSEGIAPEGIAADRATGDLFVGTALSKAVDVFDSSGALVAHLGEGVIEGGVPAIAVAEATGRVYVVDAAQNVVDVFKHNGSGAYELLSRWVGPGSAFGTISGVAVDNSTSVSDPAKGDLYVADETNNVVDVLRPKPPGPKKRAKANSWARSKAANRRCRRRTGSPSRR